MTTTKTYDNLNRLMRISSVPSGSSVVSFNYLYNSANQRTLRTDADGSRWRYGYDSLGQVSVGKKYWSDWTPVAGEQYEYAFDDIGNRTSTKVGGDETGSNLRSANYHANSLNQYTNRDVPGYLNILGLAYTTNAVTVNGQSTYRKGEFFRKELPVNNSSAPQWTNITVAANGQTSVTGHEFLPKTAEAFSYDLDGNLISDGRWRYVWDAENRLVGMITNTTIGPQISLAFEYDSKGRRIRKQVWDNAYWSGTPTNDIHFLYDGWNLLSEFRTPQSAFRTYLWGVDLSGSLQGAGGVGGLLAESQISSGQVSNCCFVAFDGNCNVSALVNATNGVLAAQYEYGPFGEVIRGTGPMARANPFRFSTKYQDDETDLLDYGYRHYDPRVGRWLSRDPAQEDGGVNVNAFGSNDPVNKSDAFGLWATGIHHQIVEDWLTDPKYRNFPWRCCDIDVVRAIQNGSDEVDGVFHNGFISPLAWCEAQSSANSYQHAMADGAAHQTPAEAAAKYNRFLAYNLVQAVGWGSYARENGRCYLLEWSLNSLGRAYHAFSDSLSPAHSGFQPWWGPYDGFTGWQGLIAYWDFVQAHEAKENEAAYAAQKGPVVAAVDKKFKAFLDYILKD